MKRLLPPLLVLGLALTYLSVLREGIPWGGDAALYIMHARNLAQGQPYAKTPYVYDDEAWMEGGPSFPPGLPLLLAPHFIGQDAPPFAAMRIECVLLLALAALPIFLFLRRSLGFWTALLATAILGLNRYTLYFVQGIMSEEAYLLFSFAALAAVYWIYDSGRDKTKPIVWGAVAGALLAYPYLIRSIGISMMVGLVLYELYRRRRIGPFLIGALAAFVAIAAFSNLLAHSDTAYRSQFRLDPSMTLAHVQAYAQSSLEVWLGLPGRRLPRIALWLITTSLAVYGLWLKLRRSGPELQEFYALSYLGILAVYWAANHRYLAPLLPLYLLYGFTAIETLWRDIKWTRPLLAAVAAAMLYAGGAYVAGIEKTPLPDGIHTATYRQALDFIRKEIPPQARLVSDSARYLALFTGRPSLLYPFWSSPEKIWAFVRRTDSSFILLSKHHEDDRSFLLPALTAHPDSLRLRFENAEYAVYQVQ